MILEVDISNNEIKPKLHPIKQTRKDHNLSVLAGKEKEYIFYKIETFNGIIKDKRQLNNHWIKFIEKQSDIYLNYWSPLSFVKNRYLRGILRRITRNMTNKRGLSFYLNLMRCEAHRDMSIEVIDKKICSYNKFKV